MDDTIANIPQGRVAKHLHPLPMARDGIKAGFSFLASSPLGQNLLTLLFVLTTLLVVVRSVESARWVATPSLSLTLVIGVLAGFGVAHFVRRHLLGHLVATVLGVILIYYQGSTLVERAGWLEQFSSLNSRLWLWWEAVVGQDASADLLPFALLLAMLAWTVGYWCTWFLLRRKNVWWVIIPSAVCLIANLSWLPESYYIYFFAYLAALLLLVAHLTAQDREVIRRSGALKGPSVFHFTALGHAVWIGALVMTLTLALPLQGWTNLLVNEASEKFFGPIDKARAELNRFFNVGAKVPSSLRHFGSVLPIQRAVPDTDEPILVSSHQVSAYWRLRSYPEYTSTAWRVENTDYDSMSDIVIPGEDDPTDEGVLGLLDLPYVHVRLLSDPPFLLVAGNLQGLDLQHLDRKADAQVYKPSSYNLDIENLAFNSALPPDLRAWARDLSLATDPSSELANLVESNVRSAQRVTKVTVDRDDGQQYSVSLDPSKGSDLDEIQNALKDGGRLSTLEVQRGPPSFGDILAVRSKPRLGEGQYYSFSPDIFIPSEDSLRNAGEDYPYWITDRYLQLPPSLPKRVKELAESLTEGITNPYDKAVVIEEYLRGLTYTNSPPPLTFDADAVDYFLFETQKGHSDYFASAMAVMLRSLAIPARLSLGYVPGVEDRELFGFLVKDKDSHTWPEVYFSGYGWVEFEPSPIYKRRPRDVTQFEAFTSPFEEDAGQDNTIEVRQVTIDNAGEQEPPEGEDGRLPGGRGLYPRPLLHFGSPLGKDGFLFGLMMVIMATTVWIIWRRFFWELYRPGGAYLRLKRLAAFLGLPSPPSETPFELVRRLSAIVPQVEQELHYICDSYVTATYAGRRAPGLNQIRVTRAWYRVRRALLKQLLYERSSPPRESAPQGYWRR